MTTPPKPSQPGPEKNPRKPADQPTSPDKSSASPQSPFVSSQPLRSEATTPEDPFQVFAAQTPPPATPPNPAPEPDQAATPPPETGTDPHTGPAPNSTQPSTPAPAVPVTAVPPTSQQPSPQPPQPPNQPTAGSQPAQMPATPFGMFGSQPDEKGPNQTPATKPGTGDKNSKRDATAKTTGDAETKKDATDSKAGKAAQNAVNKNVPYADKLSAAKTIKDKAADEGAGAAVEEVAGQGGEIAAQAAADYITGGGASALGNDHIVNRSIRRVGRIAGVATVRQWIAANKILLMSVLIIIAGLSVTLIGTLGQGGKRFDIPPPPTDEQCATMPEGWCDVVYQAQKVTENKTVPVPWTVLAGIVRNTTDFGRYSPYDEEDRYPDRPVPPYIEENFSDVSYGTDGVGGIQSYKTGPLAWGGHSNGQIPASELRPIPWAANWLLESSALDALILLNEAYKADHGGRSLGIVSSYRPYHRQQELYRQYCSGGAKPCRAAPPGTSNHGWGKAIDFANFGGMGNFSSPNYKWMVKNGPRFGWHHPPEMGPGGVGPLEPWHWEFRGVKTDVTASSSTAPAATLIGDFADDLNDPLTPSILHGGAFDFKVRNCQVPSSTLPIGGNGQEAAGPFLIKPAAANRANIPTLDFAQDPCKAANFAALILSDLAADLEEQGLAGRTTTGADNAESREFWQTVISTSDIFASPDEDSECSAVTTINRTDNDDTTELTEEEVGKLIDKIWRCRLSNAPELHVVSELGVTRGSDGKSQIEYLTFDRMAAEATLLAEARSVAWNFSKYDTKKCGGNEKGTGERGIFPVPKDKFAHPSQACDPVANINMAAQLVIAQESIPPTERELPKDLVGPYAPMMGGWLKLPVALGEEMIRFSNIGPASAPEFPPACTKALTDYVDTKITEKSVFKELADLDVAPKNTARFEAGITLFPKSVKKQCPDVPNSALASHATSILDGYVNADTGVVPNRPEGETLEDDSDQVLPDLEPEHYEEVVGDEDEITEPEPEQKTEETRTNDEMQAVQGLTNWLTWQRVKLLKNETTTLKNPSLVDRLSTQYDTTRDPAPYYAPATHRSKDGWITESIDWAIFYGGISRSWDSHGQRVGTLKHSLIRGDAAAIPTIASEKIKTLLEIAHKQIGLAYVWGAGGKHGPTMHMVNGVKVPAFDCSGFTEYVYYQVGYEIGGWTGEQKNAGKPVKSLKDAQPGDLLFFGSPKITHVGIYVEENKMIHARVAGKPLAVTSIYEKPVLIRRVIEDTPGSSGNVDGWISEALSVLYANGFKKHKNDAANLKIIIQAESSGDPTAINNWDSNAKRGDPSFGLMQTIGATFNAYSLPGYKNKDNPVHQIIAGARYAEKRYGGLEKVPGVIAVKAGKPYVGY